MTGQNGIQTKTPESLARPCSTNYHFDCHDYILLLHHSVKLYNSFYSVCILFLNKKISYYLSLNMANYVEAFDRLKLTAEKFQHYVFTDPCQI